MNQTELPGTDDPIRAALDHFIENVFPNLFAGKTLTDPNYKRVYALIGERKKELKGKPSKLNEGWIIKILQEFGGEVDGQPRYSISKVTTITINHIDNEKS